ncbi:MAG: hypothetical protein KA780_01460 [Prolixibacteraceae bacterium]|nr:hypothetical protein [Prolixibacteraceae bacterium]
MDKLRRNHTAQEKLRGDWQGPLPLPEKGAPAGGEMESLLPEGVKSHRESVAGSDREGVMRSFRKRMVGSLREEWTGALLSMAIFLFFSLWYPYHLYFQEQMQLFMVTRDYFLHFMEKPAAGVSWAGEFLTQFHYLRGGGPLVTALLLAMARRLVAAIFRRFSGTKAHPLLSLFSLLPVVILFALYLDLLYSHAATLSLLLTAGAFLAWSRIRKPGLRRILLPLFFTVGYLLAGGGMLLFLALALLWEILHAGKAVKSLLWYGPAVAGAALLFMVAVRLPYRVTWSQLFLFPLAAGNRRALLWILTGAMILVPAGGLFYLHRNPGRWATLVLLSVVTALSGAALRYRGEFRLEEILAVDSNLYFNKPEKAALLARKFKTPGSAGAYFYNLANSHTGQMARYFQEGSQTGPGGLFLPVDNRQNFVTITFSNEVYYHLGDVNASQHSAMLGMIFSPAQRSARLVRRLAQINLINGEYEVASKYLGMLESSLFHRQWALGMRRYLQNEALCEQTPWIRQKRELQPLSQELKTTHDHEKMLGMLLERNPGNTAALHYLLCLQLMKKDITAFGETFFRYAGQISQEQLPGMYQQALLILYAGERGSYNWQGVGITPEVAADFAEYTRLYEAHRGDGSPLRGRFGKSYWFYYHYANLNAEQN